MKSTSTPFADPRNPVASLSKALDAGYRYRPDEMLRFFLSEIMVLWQLPEWTPAPSDVRQQITDAIGVYDQLVAKSPPFADLLGPLYMELASHGGKSMLGQFFTPQTIADAMSVMIIGKPPADNGPLLAAADPAAGSGVMMLSFLGAALNQWGPDAMNRVSITACDIDAICCRMTAVQMVANCNVHNLQLGEILVLEGNSLGPWQDLAVVMHAQIPPPDGKAKPVDPRRLVAMTKAAKAHPDLQQLSLFPDEATA